MSGHSKSEAHNRKKKTKEEKKTKKKSHRSVVTGGLANKRSGEDVAAW